MAATAAQKAEDDAAVEDYRAKFGDAEAAKFAADLYKIRRTPAPAASAWSGLPRGVIVLIAVWVALLETAEKLPFLLLSYPQYEATLAEIHAKMLQPDLVAAQLDKARADAKTAAIQPELTSVQLDKTKLETKAAAFAPETASVQLDRARYDKQAAAYSPDKAMADLKTARWQPYLAYTQAQQARAQWMSTGPNDAWSHEYVRRLITLEPDD